MSRHPCAARPRAAKMVPRIHRSIGSEGDDGQGLPSCGRANDDDARFCSGCGGREFAGGARPQSRPPPASSPSASQPPPPASAAGGRRRRRRTAPQGARHRRCSSSSIVLLVVAASRLRRLLGLAAIQLAPARRHVDADAHARSPPMSTSASPAPAASCRILPPPPAVKADALATVDPTARSVVDHQRTSASRSSSSPGRPTAEHLPAWPAPGRTRPSGSATSSAGAVACRSTERRPSSPWTPSPGSTRASFSSPDSLRPRCTRATNAELLIFEAAMHRGRRAAERRSRYASAWHRGQRVARRQPSSRSSRYTDQLIRPVRHGVSHRDSSCCSTAATAQLTDTRLEQGAVST